MTAASGESAAVYCRGRRPRRPAATPKTSCYIRRIRNRPIVGKGLALSAQHMARHGNALHVCGFAQGCGKRGRCCAARRGRRALQRGGIALRGVCGFAGRAASVLCCCAERRGRRSLPGVCGFAEGGSKPYPCAARARLWADAGPYMSRCFLFLLSAKRSRMSQKEPSLLTHVPFDSFSPIDFFSAVFSSEARPPGGCSGPGLPGGGRATRVGLSAAAWYPGARLRRR